jgi:hypothetical protein
MPEASVARTPAMRDTMLLRHFCVFMTPPLNSRLPDKIQEFQFSRQGAKAPRNTKSKQSRPLFLLAVLAVLAVQFK